MKKAVFIVLAAVVVLGLSSCAAIFEPMKFVGTWIITDGSYEYEMDDEDPDYSYSYDGEISDGTLVVGDDGTFTFTATLTVDEQESGFFTIYGREETIEGNGVASFYTENSILSLFFDEYAVEREFDAGGTVDYTYNDYSISYSYTIDNDIMTLTREYIYETANGSNYTTTQTEEITLQKQK